MKVYSLIHFYFYIVVFICSCKVNAKLQRARKLSGSLEVEKVNKIAKAAYNVNLNDLNALLSPDEYDNNNNKLDYLHKAIELCFINNWIIGINILFEFQPDPAFIFAISSEYKNSRLGEPVPQISTLFS